MRNVPKNSLSNSLAVLLLAFGLLVTAAPASALASAPMTRLEFSALEETLMVRNPDILKNKQNYFDQLTQNSSSNSSSSGSASNTQKTAALDLLEAKLTEAEGSLSDTTQALLKLLALVIGPSNPSSANDDDSSSSFSGNSASLSLSTTKNNYNVVWTAQNAFFTYYDLKLSLEEAKNKQKELEFQHYSATIKKSFGQITTRALEDAKTQMENGQKTVASLQNQLDAAIQGFNLLLGQDADTALQLGTLPHVPADTLKKIDRDAGYPVALAESFDVRQLKTSTHSARDLENTTRTFKNDYETVYTNMIDAVGTYEKACLDTAVALKTYQLNAKKYEYGLISRGDWLKAENAYQSAQSAEFKALYAMNKAYIKYTWALRGIIIR